MADTETVLNQQIVTFVSEGIFSSIMDAMRRVNGDLTQHLDSLRANGSRSVVSSISHNSGFDGHIGYHASIVVVLDLH